MNAMTVITGDASPAFSTNFRLYEDPLGFDLVSDVIVPATRRGLARLALIAAETGARFQREADGTDPMAWLLAPRRLFNGDTALDACLAREPFLRALLLHGLAIGTDAHPDAIDALLGGTNDDESEAPLMVQSGSGSTSLIKSQAAAGGASRLFTATIVHEDGATTLRAFHASIGTDASEIVERLVSRYGRPAACAAEVIVGFDPTNAFVEALVSPALGDLLMLVDAEPCSALAAGLDLNLEQRFAA